MYPTATWRPVKWPRLRPITAASAGLGVIGFMNAASASADFFFAGAFLLRLWLRGLLLAFFFAAIWFSGVVVALRCVW